MSNDVNLYSNPNSVPSDVYLTQTTSGGGGTNYTRSTSDTLTTSDAVILAYSGTRGSSDPLSTSDGVSRQVTAFRTPSDALTVSDGVSRTSSTSTTISEALFTSDNTIRTAVVTRGSGDTAGAADLTGRQAAVARTVADALTTTDLASSASGTQYFVTVGDNAPATDAVTYVYTPVTPPIPPTIITGGGPPPSVTPSPAPGVTIFWGNDPALIDEEEALVLIGVL